MKTNEPITLSRNCEAIRIPSGQKVMLPVGAQVTVTQSLEGTYTVVTGQGYMVRIQNKDAEAIGKEAEASQAEKLTAIERSGDLGLRCHQMESAEALRADRLRRLRQPEFCGPGGVLWLPGI